MLTLSLIIGLTLSTPTSPAPVQPRLVEQAQTVQPALAQQVLEEINFARTHPRRYAQTLRIYRRYFHGLIARYPGNHAGLMTTEGVRAVDDAIRFLEAQPAMPPLRYSDLLRLASQDHVRDLGPKGLTGHRSSKDNATPSQRLQRRGGGAYVAEIITFGPPSAVEVVRQWVVNDGNPARGHRKSVFASEMVYAGIACGPHRTYRVMCVAGLGRKPDGEY